MPCSIIITITLVSILHSSHSIFSHYDIE